MVGSNHLEQTDPAVYSAIQNERQRQEDSLGLIASENHVSEAVLEAQGSVLTNKYAEGYPDARYYGGCEHVDTVEQLAIDRAKELFGADYANVQPHSGTQANMGVYFAMLDPGDRILSLDLTHGGHLSHGHHVNFSGQLYEVEQYGVDPDSGYIDYDTLADHATEFDPDLIVSGSSAYPREFAYERIDEIAAAVGAYHLADIAHVTGLIAAGLHTNPVGNADFVTASTHKTIRAGRGGLILTTDEYAEQIDKAIFPGSQGGPLMHNVAGKAVGFKEALTDEFEEYAQQVVTNAKTLADTFSERGLSLVSGGTDKHYVLVDLRDSHPDVTGSDAEEALQSVGITVNKNTVPGETRSPFTTSGIRVGTPALTTRGFTQSEMETIGHAIVDIIEHPEDDDVATDVATTVDQLCEAYPIYE
ncbi:serine hydroxymethyltransferase [Halogeometricum borinquense DSM 11551]|uniref:Serine hydroxymethyltransferase n=1 Tax=Halogeometricum borinquense (strain ATCC 700274 / DSM 11551 / JCM 10706 / KCTC 4070 / PR3) TaxID=469382 RepID=E4NW80_HALBP|nr:serine hydroxymethyltransferase [Halogeometricum borinquense]ADQ69300.1 serine hydroxymethyltransferase [Halogeometricum borinquense DSM 11551]ELY31783.1 serine hydroxymethyltransferase [Halogeometricum borinquense DSM 11551]